MGRTLTFAILAVALAGAAYVLFGSEPAPEERGSLGDSDVVEGAADPTAGPGLKAGGTHRTAQPSGPVRFTIAGRVVREDGTPVADVEVVARYTGQAVDPRDPSSYMPSAGERFEQSLQRLARPGTALEPIAAQTRTDADGQFVLAFAEPGKYRAYARPDAPDVSTTETLSVFEGQVAEQATLTLLRGAPLFGRVLDAADAPVGATITAIWWSLASGGRERWSSEPVEASPATGVYRFDAVPDGTVRLTVLLPGGRRLAGINVETPHEGEFVIRVPAAGGTIEGTVANAEGGGIADAVLIVAVTAPRDGGKGEGATTSCKGVAGADGRFRIEDAPLGRVTSIQAHAEGYLPHSDGAAYLAAQARTIQTNKPLTLDVKLSRGGTVRGRVTDKASGSGIAAAHVRLMTVLASGGGYAGTTRAAVADAEGHYVFDAVAKGRYVALPSAPGYYVPEIVPQSGGAQVYGAGGSAPEALTVVMTEEGHEAQRDLALARGFEVAGRVVDATGAGVDGAEIHARGYGLQQLAWQWGLGGLSNEPLATSSAGGRFTVPGLPPKPDWVLYATKKTYAGVYAEPLALGEGAKAPAITLKLEAGATIRGKVVDDAGKGVASVQVNFWGQTTELAGLQTGAKTDATGAFELTGVPAGDWTLNVWAQGRAGKQQALAAVSTGEVREGILVTLDAGVEVSGVIVDKDGEPIASLQLMLRSLSGTTTWTHTMTDQVGRFTFAGTPAGRSQLYTFSNGSQTPVGKPFEAPATGLRVEHERAVTVRLRGVVLGPEGESIPLATVRVGGGGPQPVGPAYMAPGAQNGTDALGGAFKLVATGTGPWTITASGARDADGRPLNLLPGKAEVTDPATEAVIRLERGLEVAGLVVDTEGKGVADVTVTGGGLPVRTDAQGRFRIVGLKKGKVMVQADPGAGYARPPARTVETGNHDVRIEIEAGLKIAGKAFGPEGKPLPQGWVTGRWDAAGGQPGGSANTQIQANGAFLLDGIPDGVSVTVQVQVWNATGGTALAPRVIENVRPGTLDLEVRLGDGLAIEGTVFGPDGKPTGGCWVYGMALEGGTQTGYVQVGEDGAWKLSGLKPGRYKIGAMVMDGGAAPGQVEVEAPARGVRIQLKKSMALAGRVEGLPADSLRWMVQLVEEDGTHLSAGIVDADGTWRIDSVREGGGIWINVTSSVQDGYARAGPVEAGRENVVLRIQKGGTITGTVAGFPDPALPMATVWAEGEHGWRSTGRLEKDGTFTIRGLPPGTYTVKARSADRDNPYAGETTGVDVGTKDVRVTLRSP